MQRFTAEIPLSRARLCVDCECIFDPVGSSNFCCPVCTGQGTASVEAWLNRVPPIGTAKQIPAVLQMAQTAAAASAASQAA